MFLLCLLVFVVNVSCFHLSDPINHSPSKAVRQESITWSLVPWTTYSFQDGPAQVTPTATAFSFFVEKPVVVALGPTVTSITTWFSEYSQFPSWFCGLQYLPVTEELFQVSTHTTWDTRTLYSWATLPVICESGGQLTSGGQAADGYSCSQTQLSTDGPQYPCCASAGSCTVSITRCTTSNCNPMYDIPCWGPYPTATISDPRAITWSVFHVSR
jgi:hypothetical protein